jgi:inner membrane protein
MPSTITHFVVGAALALPAIESAAIRRVLPRWAIPVSSSILAAAPDLDLPLMRTFNLYGFLGHRGFFHSPFFLVLFAMLFATIVARKHGRLAMVWTAVTWTGCALTHPLLDALTDAGSGISLLFPFSKARLFFPWRPIHVSSFRGIGFFHGHYLGVLGSELPFWIVASVIGICGLLLQKWKSADTSRN